MVYHTQSTRPEPRESEGAREGQGQGDAAEPHEGQDERSLVRVRAG